MSLSCERCEYWSETNCLHKTGLRKRFDLCPSAHCHHCTLWLSRKNHKCIQRDKQEYFDSKIIGCTIIRLLPSLVSGPDRTNIHFFSWISSSVKNSSFNLWISTSLLSSSLYTRASVWFAPFLPFFTSHIPPVPPNNSNTSHPPPSWPVPGDHNNPTLPDKSAEKTHTRQLKPTQFGE